MLRNENEKERNWCFLVFLVALVDFSLYKKEDIMSVCHHHAYSLGIVISHDCTFVVVRSLVCTWIFMDEFVF